MENSAENRAVEIPSAATDKGSATTAPGISDLLQVSLREGPDWSPSNQHHQPSYYACPCLFNCICTSPLKQPIYANPLKQPIYTGSSKPSIYNNSSRPPYMSPPSPASPDKPPRYICTECGRPFTRRDKLDRHMFVHSGLKPFACQLCDKAFSRQDKLKLHVRTHTGERPYICNMCDKTFTRGDKLNAHLRSHDDAERDRPYVCNVCDKTFTRGDKLNAHLRAHNDAGFAMLDVMVGMGRERGRKGRREEGKT